MKFLSKSSITAMCLAMIMKCSVSVMSAETLSVCTGEDLSLTCSINTAIVEWSVTAPGQLRVTRLLSVNMQNATRISIFVSDIAVFEAVKTSPLGVLPLVSTLYASSRYVSASLNGTVIRCDEDGANSAMKLERVINVINHTHVLPPNVSWSYLGEAMKVDNRYTLAVNLAEVHHNVLYNVSITPEPQAMSFIDNSTVHITLSYGSVYYVVVVATSTLCRNVSMSTVLGWIRNDYDIIIQYEGDSNSTDPAAVTTRPKVAPTRTINTVTIAAAAISSSLFVLTVLTMVCVALLCITVGARFHRRRRCELSFSQPSCEPVYAEVGEMQAGKWRKEKSMELQSNTAYASCSPYDY